jgi:hypothetical protein
MDFIKKLIMGAAKLAYGIFIAPIVELKNLLKKTAAEKVLTVLNAASRVIILASWFTAVPALLVTLAWVWFWISLVFAFVCLGFAIAGGGLGMALVMAAIKARTEQDVEAPVADIAEPVFA